ncbi:hypothetical protein LTR80_008093 [Exophiala xenobiotica]
MDKYHPGYFGKVGMRYFHLTRNQYWKPTINLDKLWSLVPEETRDEYVSGKKTDTAPVLDLLPLGYSKVLGKGRIPEIPIVVRARWFSKEAERKIKEAGGVVDCDSETITLDVQLPVMDNALSLFDTPKKASLQRGADTLRTALKDYERTFAATHNGRKPGKDDIKSNQTIATKYKEYNKVRDVLAGNLGLAALNPPQPKVKHFHTRTDSAISLTPQKSRHRSTPSKPRVHPNEIDPYDAPPSSISPRPMFHAIGPTPRRDGTVIGIFDMLPPSGSIKSSQETPSSRKRKVDALQEDQPNDDNTQETVTQTPSQRRSHRRAAASGKNHNMTATPTSREDSSNRKHSKTPISQSKRFMLDHFFATPSAVRFSNLVEHDDGDDDDDAPHLAGTRAQTKTPLRDALLGINSPAKQNTEISGTDATPPYLKRSFSFKERLLSASGGRPSSSASMRGYNINVTTSPTQIKKGPRVGLRGAKFAPFAPKPLSQMIAELQSQSQTEAVQGGDTTDRVDHDDADDDDDDMEALREMEAGEVNVLVNDSQAGAVGLGQSAEAEPPMRVWKKKGQKRTTRRVIMRPVKMKPAAAPKFVAADDDDDDDDQNEESSEDELALDSAHAHAHAAEDDDRQGGDVSRVEETQLLHGAVAHDDGDVDGELDDMEYLIAEAEAERDGEDSDQLVDSDEDAEFLLESEDVPRTTRATKNKGYSSAKSKAKGGSAADSAGKSSSSKNGPKAKTKAKAKDKAKDKDAAEDGKTSRTINPNAYSHMNFRSLKIKNKNSKAKGRGRFGRGRR